jgi:peroxiredoxin
MPTYESANVLPLGLNPAGADSHRRYGQKLRLPFPLLSDRERAATRAYGALKLGGRLVQRSVVLVDQDGLVRFAAVGAHPAERVLTAAGWWR